MNSTFLLQALGGRSRSFIVWLAGLLGLNLILLAAYFSSDVVRAIQIPLFELSASGLFFKVLETISAPLIGLIGAIAGFYFSPSTKNKTRNETTSNVIAASAWNSAIPAVRAVIVLGSHAVVAAVMIALNYGLQHLLFLIYENSEVALGGVLPLRYLFYTLNWSIVVVFLIFGVGETIRALKNS